MTDPDFAGTIRRAMRKVLDAPYRPTAPEPVHPEVWREAVAEYRRGEGSPEVRAFMRRALGEDGPRPVRVLSYANPHTADCECESIWSDPALVDHIDRMFQAALAEELVVPEPPRLPDTALDVLVASSLTFAYFAEFDRLSAKLIDGDGTGRPLGILGGADVDTVREHVRRDLVPLVRAAATTPPLPPKPPGPGQPPYLLTLPSVTDPMTGFAGDRWSVQALARHRVGIQARGWGKSQSD